MKYYLSRKNKLGISFQQYSIVKIKFNKRRILIKLPLREKIARLRSSSPMIFLENKNSSNQFDIAVSAGLNKHTRLCYMNPFPLLAWCPYSVFQFLEEFRFFLGNHISDTLLPYSWQIEREWAIFSGHAGTTSRKTMSADRDIQVKLDMYTIFALKYGIAHLEWMKRDRDILTHCF